MNDYVIRAVDTLVSICHTREAFKLIEMLNIYWSQAELGRLKGYYRIINKERHIVTNEDLCEYDLHIVLAHEIVHERLNRHIAMASPIIYKPIEPLPLQTLHLTLLNPHPPTAIEVNIKPIASPSSCKTK